MSSQDRVTLCMITKNEENCITSCINSVRHLIDEIVVVDTGSTDHTVDRALKVGAKVFHYTWQGDFAKARNFAIEQATGDWILVLDADEIVAYVSLEKFQELLSDSRIEGYLIDIESCIGNGEEKIFDQVVRLFRNKEKYRFWGAIHEQVVGSIREQNQGQGIGIASVEFKIIHSGYLSSRVEEKNKHARNIAVINQALRNHSSDPFLHYSLAMEYIQQGKVSQANEELGKSLKMLTGGEGYFSSVVVNLASGLIQTGQWKEGGGFLEQAMIMLPQDSNLMLLKGLVTLYHEDYLVAVQFLQKSIIGNQDNSLVSSIHTLCGDIYNIVGYYDKAELEYFTSLQLVPWQMYPLLQLIGLKQKGKSQLSWHELSKFTSPEINKNLQLQLGKMKERHLVLVVALLNIINQKLGKKANLIVACKDYLQAIILYQPVDELSKTVIQYLKFSAETMFLYAKEVPINIPVTLLPVMQEIENISNDNLALLIKTLCPTWIPCITLHNIKIHPPKSKNGKIG